MNTYNELVSAVAAYMGQEGNTEVTSQVPLFVSLGEADIYRVLRHDRMVKNVPVGTISPYLLPDDFLEMSGVFHDYNPCIYAGPEDVLACKPPEGSIPTKWSILGNELVFNGIPTSVTVMSYFAKPPNLEDEVNPLFILNPDLYLYAALSHAMIFLRDEQRQGVWDALFSKKLQEIVGASWDARLPLQEALKYK